MNSNKKVLMIATSHKTKGGITSVIQLYKQCPFWKEHHVKWIETHIDKNIFYKLWYAIKSIITFLFIAPFYDIVHIHFSKLPSALRKFFIFIIGKVYGKKIILHFHAEPETTIKGKSYFLYSFMFKHSDKIIVLSESSKKWFNNHFHLENNICVIYNPCVPNQSKSINSRDREPIILYAGTLSHLKGYQDLIRSFSSIAKKYPNWKIVFAGNGEIANGLKLAEQLGISSQTEFIGWISGKEKEKLFASASIFCLPSYTEGFPMAILDACSFELPIITTPVGGIPDIIKDKINGLLFPPGDTNSLCNLLDLLISDDKQRARLSQESKSLAENEFNLNKIAIQIDRLYNSM